MIRLRKSLAALQRSIVSAAADQGVTQECAASHLGCSGSRVSFWTAKDLRAMSLDDLFGLLELADDPLKVLRPLHDALGVVAVTRPTSEAHAGGRLERGVLGATMLLGDLAREIRTVTEDGQIDQDENAAILERLRELRHELDGLEATLTHAPRAVGSRR